MVIKRDDNGIFRSLRRFLNEEPEATTSGMPEDPAQLKSMLAVARDRMFQQGEILRQIGEKASVTYAIVVAVGRNSGREIVAGSVATGSIVRILEGEHTGKYAMFVEKKDDSVCVRLMDGKDLSLESRQITLLGAPEGTAVISFSGRLHEVQVPPDKKIQPGDHVRIFRESMQIIDLADINPASDIATVLDAKDGRCEVNLNGNPKIVSAGKFTGKLRKGDRVAVDPSGMIVLENLGRRTGIDMSGFPKVHWDDIGGLKDLKKEIRSVLEDRLLHPEPFKKFNIPMPTGFLIVGPPGNGKTMIGRAIATFLAELHGEDSIGSGYICADATEFLQKYVGDGEAMIRDLAARAEEHFEEHKFPAVIFIDEADASLRKRGSGKSSDATDTLVNATLTAMGGLKDAKALWMFATNKPEALDEALTRSKRINAIFHVPRPDEETTTQIFGINLKKYPVAAGTTLEEMARIGTEELFSDKHVIYEKVKTQSGVEANFTLADIRSGAMITDIVDRAAKFATERWISTKQETSMTKDDLIAAVKFEFEGRKHLAHVDALVEFMRSYQQHVPGDTQIQVQKP